MFDGLFCHNSPKNLVMSDLVLTRFHEVAYTSRSTYVRNKFVFHLWGRFLYIN